MHVFDASAGRNTSDQIVGINSTYDHPPLILLLLLLQLVKLSRSKTANGTECLHVDHSGDAVPVQYLLRYTLHYFRVYIHSGQSPFPLGPVAISEAGIVLFRVLAGMSLSYAYCVHTSELSIRIIRIMHHRPHPHHRHRALSNPGPWTSQNCSIRPFVRSLGSVGNAHVSACVSTSARFRLLTRALAY